MALKPGQIVDRYVIQRPLGRGGMSRVYLAKHQALGSLHALKVLEKPSRQGRKRLKREGMVMSQLQHPNVARVTDLIELSDRPVLVVEYVPDGTLDQLLVGQPVDQQLGEDLALQLMAGVEAAHSEGVVHRDLKPSNVLLHRQSAGWVAKVADFGIARVFADRIERLTPMGVPMGTRGYSAPEQFLSAHDVDVRADVFSLGAVLYELLGGQRAFTVQDLMQGAWNGSQPRTRIDLSRLRPSLPERIVLAIEGALVLDRNDRIPDVATMRRIWLGEKPWTVPGRDLLPDDEESWGSPGFPAEPPPAWSPDPTAVPMTPTWVADPNEAPTESDE